MQRKFVTLVLTLSAALFAGSALAQAKPDVLVKQRQAGMTMIGKYFSPLGGMAAGRVPFNAQTVARNAGYLDVLAKLPWDGFDASTSGEKSATLPAAFSDSAKFKEAGDRMQTAITALVTASKGNDEAAIKTAIGGVVKTCSACHDSFRQKQ